MYLAILGHMECVVRILFGVHLIFLPRKSLPLLVVALKTHDLKITSPTAKSPQSSKNGLLLCLGVHLQLSPVNLSQKKFYPPWGVPVHPVHPLATPML